jgi:hypothetical protein
MEYESISKGGEQKKLLYHGSESWKIKQSWLYILQQLCNDPGSYSVIGFGISDIELSRLLRFFFNKHTKIANFWICHLFMSSFKNNYVHRHSLKKFLYKCILTIFFCENLLYYQFSILKYESNSFLYFTAISTLIWTGFRWLRDQDRVPLQVSVTVVMN